MADIPVWTDERLNKLKKLWEQGLSISQIGEELDVSRNAIAGKVYRLGLPKRQSPISGASSGPKAAPKSDSIADMDASTLPLKLALRTINWSSSQCSWPIGDPKSTAFRFCGENVVQGKPYCNEHCFDAYTTSRESGSN